MEQAPHRLRIASDRAQAERVAWPVSAGPPAESNDEAAERAAAPVLMLEAFDVPGIPEIAKAADAQRRARLALINGDHAKARELSAEAARFSHLARVRLTSRKERGTR